MLGPFETVGDAEETQAAIAGKSKVYQAGRKGQAEAEYLEFLRKVATGRDSW